MYKLYVYLCTVWGWKAEPNHQKPTKKTYQQKPKKAMKTAKNIQKQATKEVITWAIVVVFFTVLYFLFSGLSTFAI